MSAVLKSKQIQWPAGLPICVVPGPDVPDDWEHVPQRMTPEAYFRFDRDDPDHKYEYWDGLVIMMPGGTFEHATVKTRLIISLGNRLGDGPCRPLDSDMRVEVDPLKRGKMKGRYVYPDASVYCGDPQFRDDDPEGERTTLLNPTVVFEVTSEWSERRDRTAKFRAYLNVPSLRAYVILARDRAEADVFERQADGNWKIGGHVGLDAVVRLDSIDVDLPLSELYRGVALVPDDDDAASGSASDDSSD